MCIFEDKEEEKGKKQGFLISLLTETEAKIDAFLSLVF